MLVPTPLGVPSSGRRAARCALALAALAALPAALQAQEPVKRDSVPQVEEITVTVTRAEAPLSRVPAAIGVLDRTALTRAQPTIGLDEAVSNLPGVFVSNRYNFAQDQRLAIRGAGARANFGTRGIKVLLDGIPQTLPDGQSQLSNVEYGLLERVEVLRGASSALYGNAAGGVLSLQSQGAGPEAFSQRLRVEGGAFDTWKAQSITTARSGPVSGVLSLSRLTTDGPREYSSADVRLLNFGLTVQAAPRTTLDLRALATDWPEARNAGALTPAEYAADPTLSAPANITRGANERTKQQQLSLTLRHLDPERGGEYVASVFGLLRDLDNWLATPPPGPFVGAAGTFSRIDREVGGLRLAGTRRVGSGYHAPRVTVGLDAQRMQDDRRNRRSLNGAATDSVLVDQREVVTEVGPFVQVQWAPTLRLTLTGGVRHDWIDFDVEDRWFSDGADNSLTRANRAFSGTVGASYWVSDAFQPYGNVSTAFETPTTTELASQPSGGGGFGALDPQRTRSIEVGARGRHGGWLEYSAAAFFSRVSDAIVQFSEVNGRAFFTNAGRTENNGLELGVSVRPIPQVRAFASFTYSDFTFGEYRIQRGAAVDTLDGLRLPGVPRYFTRLGLRTEPVRGVALDLDHTFISSITANDRGTEYIDNVGAGITNIRVSWAGAWGGYSVAPFLGLNNAWDRTYASSVIVNATLSRFIEPAAGRNLYLGAEIGWRSGR